jgi:GT2 family glycosyltransferase
MAVDAARLRDVGGFNTSFRTAEDRDLCDRWRLAGLPLAFAPDAVVGHAHRMTLASFIRQHAGYGRGAHRFMRAHRQRHRTTSTFEPMFYTGLLPRALRLLRGRRRPAALAALLVVWQLANAAGYLQAWAGGMAAPARGSR